MEGDCKGKPYYQSAAGKTGTGVKTASPVKPETGAERYQGKEAASWLI